MLDVEQGSDEWKAARAGRLCASRAADMMAMLKNGGESAARRDLRLQLVTERITNQPQDDQFVNADMRRGTELEPDARALYEAQTDTLVRLTGFLAHTELLCGVSLDGHIGDFEGVLELKVPRPATHIRYLRAGVLPAEHRYQVTHQLFVTGAAWCDFVSYCPALPEGGKLFRVRVERDNYEIQQYELALRFFLGEVDKEAETVLALVKAVA